MPLQLLSDPRPLQDLPNNTLLAIDTEFHSERRYTPELHLIQVQKENGPPWLVDPHNKSLLEDIAPHLTRQPWLLHAGQMDLPLLEQALGSVPAIVLDTQICAGLVEARYPTGLSHLLQDNLHLTIPKSQTLSDWSRRPLSPEQRQYAADDVANLHALWDVLIGRAKTLSRVEIVERACAASRQRSLSGPDSDQLWRRVSGRQSLAGPNLCVLQDLTRWRETLANQRNQPAHALINNRTLLDLAKRLPLDETRLLRGRRSPKKTLQRYSTDLLEIINHSKNRTELGWPVQASKGTADVSRLAWLQAFAEIEGQHKQWAKRLVLPDSALEQIACGVSTSIALQSWQRELIGSEIQSALIGDRLLRYPATEVKDF